MGRQAISNPMLVMIACCLAVSVSCTSSNHTDEVRGMVTVDGAPVDMGTIHFVPSDTPGAGGVGAAVNAGQFQLVSDDGVALGKYSVAVQASKKTGRTFKDPQRGEVPVIEPLELVDSPKEVELTNANAENLELKFSARTK